MPIINPEKRIIHIAPDEKFIGAADWLFKQAFPKTQHIFYIVQAKNTPLKHIQPKENYQIISDTKTHLEKLKNQLSKNDFVVVHYLLDFSCRLRLSTSPDIPFMWLMWGKDIYESGIYNSEMYGPKTLSISRVNIGMKFAKNAAKILLGYAGKIIPLKKKIKAVRQMQFIGMFYHEEFDLFYKAQVFALNTRPVRFKYNPIEFFFKDNQNEKIHGNNIQIGNSATATNNHLEVFDMLRKMDLGERKIIVPLSYGNKKYGHLIKEKGQELFQNKFHPLLDFMPLHEYQKTMQSCGVVIMNHYRQQALGNIISMIWMGAKVYLNTQSTVYQFLSRIGVHIYSIEDNLTKSNVNALQNLDDEKIAHNRRILFEHYSQETIIQNLKDDLAEFEFH